MAKIVSAAENHTKSRYIYEIGLDWYNAARTSSLFGDKSGDISSIENALKYDRDAENSAAIPVDYLAYSKILLKENPSEEDVKKFKPLKELSERVERREKITYSNLVLALNKYSRIHCFSIFPNFKMKMWTC